MQTLTLSLNDPLPEPLNGYNICSVEFPRALPVAGSTPVEQTGYRTFLPQIVENCIIHDLADNGWWAFAPGANLHGIMRRVIAYNIGWRGTDRDHGHCGYFQNYADSTRLIEQCIFLAGFSTPFKIYASGNEHKDELTLGFLSIKNKSANYTIRDTIVVGYECFVGTESRWGAHNIVIENCAYLDAGLRMGYKGQNGDGSIVNSLLVGGMNTGIFDRREPGRTYLDARGKAVSWRNLVVTGNTFVLPGTTTVSINLPGAAPDWEWDHNEYWSDSLTPFNVTIDTGTTYQTHSNLSFDDYRELTGFDEHSTFHLGQPPFVVSKVYPGWGGASWGITPPPPGTSWYPPPPVMYDWSDVAPSLAPLRSEVSVWTGASDLQVENWLLKQAVQYEQFLRTESDLIWAAREAQLIDDLASATLINSLVLRVWKAIDALFLKAETNEDFSVELQIATDAVEELTPHIGSIWFGSSPSGGIGELMNKIEQLQATLVQLQTDTQAVIDELNTVEAENAALNGAIDAFISAVNVIRTPVVPGS